MNQQTKKQVATKNSTAVAAPTMDLSLVAKDAGQGLSEVNMDKIQILFLKILSSMSPQTKKQRKNILKEQKRYDFQHCHRRTLDGAEGITVVHIFEPVEARMD